ncbi:ATP citrate synthase [Candidatus Woesearchaeota archaeon]|nr:ATP citrate synthase [Candidatus Woesearchaeota archaeon]
MLNKYSKRQPYELFTKDSQTFFLNLKEEPVQRMLDFDFLSKRTTPSIAAIIHSGRRGYHKAFFGATEILLPIYPTLHEAVQNHPAIDSIINFASFRSAYQSSKEAILTPSIKTITIVAEGIPERQVKELIAIAKEHHKTIIGPATVGALVAGQFRVGHAGGMIENILKAKLYRPGSVGYVSKSGGMMNEMFHIISRATDGIYEGVAIGGDVFPGSTLLDHILRFEQNPNIKMIIALGELGGRAEYEIIEAKQQKKITKPIVMWVSGTCANLFPFSVQFGHAGAKANKDEETAQAKNKALKNAGITVPENFESFEATIHKVYNELVLQKKIMPKTETQPPAIPQDYNQLVKQGLVRRPSSFTSTISDDRGDEPTYNKIPISTVVEKNLSVGDVIGLLWFKKQLPPYFSKFLSECIILCADHGPAVATAHNAMVAARAGKDVISSLIAGLSTIGPVHGGAIDDAVKYFKDAVDRKLTPAVFIEEMKQKGIRIPGIGHRVKSKKNPDKRVELLKDFAKKNFPQTKYLQYALSVEDETTKKADSLILNVDGTIAALFLDVLEGSKLFSDDEIKDIVAVGYMNGIFAVSRSIGIIGHILDQKRLGEGLYRHPTDDICYL